MTPEPIADFAACDIPAMETLARKLGLALQSGDVVTLRGEVGAGKTTFARALIGEIAEGRPEVTSPTFTLMQSYDVRPAGGVPATLWHLDLYRLEEEKELEALGLSDLWEHILLIEWPEIAARLLPEGRLDLHLAYGPAPDTRRLTLHGNGAWRERLASLL